MNKFYQERCFEANTEISVFIEISSFLPFVVFRALWPDHSVSKRMKTSITLSEETFQESRGAVALLSGAPLYLTLAELLDHTL